MKKGIIVLVGALLLSVGLNMYFIISRSLSDKVEPKVEDKVFIKYDKRTISDKEFMDSFIRGNGDRYIYTLKDKILKENLTEAEITGVEDDAEESIEMLKSNYGDKLEEEIRKTTYYSTIEEYQNYIVIEWAYEKRAEAKCENEDDIAACSSTGLMEEMYKVLSNTDITFESKELENHWNKYLKEFKEDITNAQYAEEHPDIEDDDIE